MGASRNSRRRRDYDVIDFWSDPRAGSANFGRLTVLSFAWSRHVDLDRDLGIHRIYYDKVLEAFNIFHSGTVLLLASPFTSIFHPLHL